MLLNLNCNDTIITGNNIKHYDNINSGGYFVGERKGLIDFSDSLKSILKELYVN